MGGSHEKGFALRPWVVLACLWPLTVSAVTASALLTPDGQVTGPLKLEDGTPVKIRLQRTISPADAQVDDRVDSDVLEEIKVGNVLVIPKGSVAWGTVTDAQPKRRMGRGGKLDVNIDAVRLADGEKAALRGMKDVKDGGHTDAVRRKIAITLMLLGRPEEAQKYQELAAAEGENCRVPGERVTAAPRPPLRAARRRHTRRTAPQPYRAPALLRQAAGGHGRLLP